MIINNNHVPVFYLWAVYLFIAMWEFRLELGSSWLPLGQMIVLALTSISLLSIGKFRIYKTIDDSIIWLAVLFIGFNSMAHMMFSSDADYALMRMLSMFASLIIILPFYVSRSINTEFKQNLVILLLFLGMSMYVIDVLIGYITAYLQYRTPFVGRSTVGQRIPVIINLVFMLGLLYKTRNRYLLVYARVIAFVSLFLMVVSLTRSAYIALCVDLLVLLFIYKNKKIIISTLILLFALLAVGAYSDIFNQVGSRFSFMMESIRNPAVDYSASYRIEIWSSIYNYLVSTPVNLLFGTGELGIAYLQREITVFGDNYIALSAESQYFDTILRRGVLGFSIFVFILYRSIMLSWALVKKQAPYAWIYISIFTWLLAMVPYNLFNESIRYRTIGILFYVIYGFLVSQSMYSKKNRDMY
jgi:O-antigen ligase